MSFFDLLPVTGADPEPPTADFDVSRQAPQPGVIGGAVGGPLSLTRSEKLYLGVAGGAVYPNGLLLTVELQLADSLPPEKSLTGFPWCVVDRAPKGPPPDCPDPLRFGVEYANGDRAVTTTWRREGGAAPGITLVPLSQRFEPPRWTVDVFISPCPPAGPVRLAWSWSAMDIPEGQVDVGAELLDQAVARIESLW